MRLSDEDVSRIADAVVARLARALGSAQPHGAEDEYAKPRAIDDLARALNDLCGIVVSPATLYRLIRRRELPVTDVGGKKRSTVAAYLAVNTKGLP